MKIIIFGAAGEVGSRVVTEAASRGHRVTVVVRRATQLESFQEDVIPVLGDADQAEDLDQLCAEQDLIISAIRPAEGKEHSLTSTTESILAAAARSAVRVLIVGGAASLKIPNLDGFTVLTAPGFLPESVINIARACFEQHQLCRADKDASWTYICPPAMLLPGERTGLYRLGKDELVIDSEGQSKISMEDFAVVLLDEAEKPTHIRTRFTVGY